MALPGSPLVGRDAELGVLEAVLDELSQGGSPALIVSGEPGIGKSRTLGELLRRAAERGALTFSGRAAEYEVDLPLAPWIDALDERLLDGPPDGLRAADRLALAPLFPALAESGDAQAPLAERHRLHAAMRSLLTVLASDGPLVIVLDDLHWADSASLDLVAALLRRPPSAAVLLALSLRPRQAPERLSAALARAERESRTVTLALLPLEPEAATTLLGASVPAHLRDVLFLESGGNPFYLEQLARMVQTQPTLPRAAAPPAEQLAGVPRTVSAALAEELRGLPPVSRVVLDAAAVTGAEFDPAAVAAIAEVDERAALDALDELTEAGLVRALAGTRRFSMRHPIIRRAVYAGSGAGWRLAAHQRAAAALRADGAAPEEYAHHLVAAARPGDEQAAAELVAAAAGVRTRAPASAARWLSVALELSSAVTPAERRHLLAELAGAQAASGHAVDALGTLEHALDTLPGHEVAEAVPLICGAARLEHLLGRHQAAHERLLAGLARVPAGAGETELELLVALAVDAFHRRDVAGMGDWARRAAARGDALGRPAHAAAGHAIAAFCDALVGDIPAALAACERAATGLDRLDDEQLAECLEAVQFIGLAEMYLEQFDAAVTHARRGTAAARAGGQTQMVPVIAIPHGFAAAMLGRLDEALGVLDGAVEETRLVDSGFALAWVSMNSAFAAVLAGDVDRARAVATEVVELLAGMDESVVVANAKSVLGQVELLEERPGAAIATLHDAGGGPDLPLIGGFWKVFLLESLTEAHLSEDDLAAATASAERAEAAAAQLGLPLTRGTAKRALARVALKRGDAAGALALALEATAAADNSGAALEASDSRLVSARALAAVGRRSDAVAQARQAAETLEACHAPRRAEQAHEVLRHLGDRQRHSARGDRDTGGIASLTRREREIAELVWDRRTNREIAETLFLSAKTIESHLRNIFAKTLVSSRVDLAREVERARNG